MNPLSLIVPCYNEENRLNTAQFSQWIGIFPDWQWIFVNDGSLDGTLALLQELASRHESVRVLALPKNVGKAEAVREGVLSALGDGASSMVGYLDADLATAPSEIQRMLDLTAGGSLQAVIGCRVQRLGAQIDRKMFRHYAGRIAASLISLLLKLPTYDTQCGAKVFSRSLATQIFSEPFLSRWLFDVELLARIRNLVGRDEALSIIHEMPLDRWQDLPGSKIRLKDVLWLPLELRKLHAKYNR